MKYIVFLIILFYSPLMSLNFIQDDFFCLLISKSSSIADFFVFFTPQHSFITSDYMFYRPLSTQFYFGLMKIVFGLQPVAFHLASICVHIINVCLVYLLVKKLFGKKAYILPIASAFIYGFNQNHFVTIGWASNIQELLVTTFILLTIIFYKDNGHIKSYLQSFVFFLFALLSKETAITLPVILFLVTLFYDKKKYWLKLLPFVAVLCVYLYIHFIQFHFVQTNGYRLAINLQAINNFKWYVLWGVGMPEMFVDYIGPHLSIIPTLWKYYFTDSIIIFSLFVLVIVSICFGLIEKIKEKNYLEIKNAIFLLGFYVIFILPIIFFPENKYPYHQTTALVGLAVLLANVLVMSSKKATLINLFIFAILQIFAFQLTYRTSAVTQRSRFVGANLVPFVRQYQTLPGGTVLYFRNDSNYPRINDAWGGSAKQLSIAISQENAFKLYYGKSIRVYFDGVSEPPKDTKLVELIARAP